MAEHLHYMQQKVFGHLAFMLKNRPVHVFLFTARYFKNYGYRLILCQSLHIFNSLATYFDGLFRGIKSQNIFCLGLIHNEHVSVTLWCTQVVPFKITSYACCNIYEIIDTIFYSVVQYSIKIHIIISFP